MTWKTCKIHGDDKPNAWGCPECLRELRDENKRLKKRDEQWFKFALAVGLKVNCLASSFPEENAHILKMMSPDAPDVSGGRESSA